MPSSRPSSTRKNKNKCRKNKEDSEKRRGTRVVVGSSFILALLILNAGNTIYMFRNYNLPSSVMIEYDDTAVREYGSESIFASDDVTSTSATNTTTTTTTTGSSNIQKEKVRPNPKDVVNPPNNIASTEICHYNNDGPAPKAPWDPGTMAGYGHAVIQQVCAHEIIASGCHHTLPISTCLLRRQEAPTKLAEQVVQLGEPCKKLLYPCSYDKQGIDCTLATAFSTSFNQAEIYQLENILAHIDMASRMHSSVYWMAAGSAIGTLVHHASIPWDDDTDIYLLDEHLDIFIEDVRSLGLSISWLSSEGFKRRSGKIFNASWPKIRSQDHSYPYVDFFSVSCKEGQDTCVETNSKAKHSIPKEWVFPLKRRPFGRMSLPFPTRTRDAVEARYGAKFKKKCMKGAYDHRKERFKGRQAYVIMNCSELKMPPAVVWDKQDDYIFQKDNFSEELLYIPWPDDFPELHVEYIVDSGIRLSSVLYDSGNEIRRSYADGLLDVDKNVITYSLPTLAGWKEKLIPFLQEERLSFVHNTAKRSAKEINEEVLPILDRVVISNNFRPYQGNRSEPIAAHRRFRIGEWNAERGKDWDIFPNFYPDADIIILNEMDWGMARSGNKDTTKQMAMSLKMNYAYGVEFMELTNGNEQEINETLGQDNLIGYHGNVVLSKWPIGKSKVVRLHPLYDLLYEKKTTGIASGERRLGGRMALFADVQTDVGDILVISMHAHAGSKRELLTHDAKVICGEIDGWNATTVLIGGDISRPIPQLLVSECGFYPLEQTNGQPWTTWKIVCPNGSPPQMARYPTRGDWILARGSGFDIASFSTATMLPYRRHDRNNEEYQCVSDHALLTFEADFFAKTIT